MSQKSLAIKFSRQLPERTLVISQEIIQWWRIFYSRNLHCLWNGNSCSIFQSNRLLPPANRFEKESGLEFSAKAAKKCPCRLLLARLICKRSRKCVEFLMKFSEIFINFIALLVSILKDMTVMPTVEQTCLWCKFKCSNSSFAVVAMTDHLFFSAGLV